MDGPNDFSQLLDELFDSESNLQKHIENSMAHAVEATNSTITQVQKAVKNIIPHIKPKVSREHKNRLNLTTEKTRREFAAEDVFGGEQYSLFTDPQNTTNTLGASFSGESGGIYFHEEQLIKYVRTTKAIHGYDCNYGHTRSPDFISKIIPPKSTRGRKKKTPTKKPRKPQGDGSSFNSQITFLVRNPDSFGPTYFRIKVFRTGELQIPGVTQPHINAIYDCIGAVRDQLQESLLRLRDAHPEAVKCPDVINIAEITPVMKNYKFSVIHRENQLLRLDQLKKILLAKGPAEPLRIIHVKYSKQEPAKLSIKFHTPIPGNTTKGTRVNVFISGKINILGAFEVSATQKICDYLHSVFENHRLTLVGTMGVPFANEFAANRRGRWIRLMIESVMYYKH